MDILKFPLARVTIWLVAGIVVSAYIPPNRLLISISLIFCILLFGASYYYALQNRRQNIGFGIALAACCFVIGIANEKIHHGKFQHDNYIHQIRVSDDVYQLHVTIREKLKSNAYNNRFIALVNAVDGNPTSGKILLNLNRKGKGGEIQIGANLLVTGRIRKEHQTPLNPNQFDYGKYLSGKSVYAQMNIAPADYSILSTQTKDIWFYSDRLRNRIIKNLEKSGFAKDDLQVANALILGQQQEISKDIIRDYQLAGAVHILSVSGLHVGFILLFLNLILKPIPKNKNGRIIKFIIILISLWSFAVIAGFSPSVVRSATMFSFVALGMSIRRGTNIFHTLLVSLLLILLFEPSFLFDVGFQLSYTALFFILWFQPLLSKIWTPGNRIVGYFWDILTVSFAAQIGAFPLSVYYFHQFPGLFFITNLVVIPFVSVIMLLGVFVMVLSLGNIVLLWPLNLLEWCISAMNSIIKKIATFDDFIIQDIPMDFCILLSLYLLIVTAILWLKNGTFPRLSMMLISLLIFQVTVISTKWNVVQERELIVFNVRKNTLVAERSGDSVAIFTGNPDAGKSVLKPYLTANFSSLTSNQSVPNHLFFDGEKIFVIDSAAIYPEKAQADIIVLTNSPKLNLERMLQNGRPKIIVADASNFKSYCARWKNTCAKQKIPFHNTSEKGFFRIKK